MKFRFLISTALLLLGLSLNAQTWNAPPKSENPPSQSVNDSDVILDADCTSNTRGSFCFDNTTSGKVQVDIKVDKEWNGKSVFTSHGIKTFTIDPNDNECVFDLVQGSYHYTVSSIDAATGRKGHRIKEGDIYVQKCKVRREKINK